MRGGGCIIRLLAFPVGLRCDGLCNCGDCCFCLLLFERVSRGQLLLLADINLHITCLNPVLLVAIIIHYVARAILMDAANGAIEPVIAADLALIFSFDALGNLECMDASQGAKHGPLHANPFFRAVCARSIGGRGARCVLSARKFGFSCVTLLTQLG